MNGPTCRKFHDWKVPCSAEVEQNGNLSFMCFKSRDFKPYRCESQAYLVTCEQIVEEVPVKRKQPAAKPQPASRPQPAARQKATWTFGDRSSETDSIFEGFPGGTYMQVMPE